MGALHEGHVRLIERCRGEAGFVVVSIFVNPTQFGPTEDFARYPRTLEDDLDALRRGGGRPGLRARRSRTMYPHGLGVDLRRGARPLRACSRGPAARAISGAWRPSSSSSSRSSARTSPSSAQKDYQQQLVIRRMVEDLDVPVDDPDRADVREPDGLAMSSRNRYLEPGPAAGGDGPLPGPGSAREAVAAGERDADRVRQILRRNDSNRRSWPGSNTPRWPTPRRSNRRRSPPAAPGRGGLGRTVASTRPDRLSVVARRSADRRDDLPCRGPGACPWATGPVGAELDSVMADP